MYRAESNPICMPFVEGCIFAKQTLQRLSKTCLDAISLKNALNDSWPTKHLFIFSVQIISFVPLWHCSLSTEMGKKVCVPACTHAHLLFTGSDLTRIQSIFFSPSAWKASQSAQQPASQAAGKAVGQTQSTQAAPLGEVCCSCARKHCYSVKPPLSSKGYRVIRYTGDINNSAPEKLCTQLPHLLAHISHLLPLWWGLIHTPAADEGEQQVNTTHVLWWNPITVVFSLDAMLSSAVKKCFVKF